MSGGSALSKLVGPVRQLVEKFAPELGLTPEDLAKLVIQKEHEVPTKFRGELDRQYGALYGVLVQLQPVAVERAFALPGKRRKKGEVRPRLPKWALEVFGAIEVSASFVELPDGRLLEEILTPDGPRFVCFRANPETWEIVEEMEVDGTLYLPVPIEDKLRNALTLPDGLAEYGSVGALLDAGSEEERPIWRLWILNMLASWIAVDLFKGMPEAFLPILPVVGPSGSGKKRTLSVVRHLAYRGMYFLKTTRAPSLYRTIDPWGTVFLVLDEADLFESGETADFIQFLNSRADRVTIPRYSPDANATQLFLSFGYTALALRRMYGDTGVVSRSLSLSAESTAREVDLILPSSWAERARLLQQKLLLWRMRTVVRIRRGDLSVPTRLELAGVKSHRVREALLVLSAIAGEDSRVAEVIREVATDLERRLVRQSADSPEGLILNTVYQWLDEECGVVPDGSGFRLQREEGRGEQVRTVPLTLSGIRESLGNVMTTSEIARWVRGLQIDIRPRLRLSERRFRGVIRIRDPSRLDRQFFRFVVDSTPRAHQFTRERQEELPSGNGEESDKEETTVSGGTGGTSGTSGSDGDEAAAGPVVSGPPGPDGPPTGPELVSGDKSTNGDHRGRDEP